MKHSAEYDRFTRLVDKVLSVSKEEIDRREAEYRKRADANPRKRGPKRKVKPPSASPDPAAAWSGSADSGFFASLPIS
jgi:hypothetical protein